MSQPQDATLLEHLTPREREVLHLLRLGLTDREIAMRLEITPQGASYHVSQIIRRLGVRNRQEASTWPERPPWWLAMAVAFVQPSRRVASLLSRPLSSLARPLLGLLIAIFLVSLGLFALLLWRGGGTATPQHNMIVFSNDGGFWVTTVDAKEVPRKIMDNGSLARYVGYLRAQSGVYIYFLNDSGETNQDGQPLLALYRVTVDGGQAELVFHPLGQAADLFVGPTAAASISPDGKHLLYGHGGDIDLIDLESGDTARVIASNCQPQGCVRYGSPRWSPGGEVAGAMSEFLEGGPLVLVRPFASPPAVAVTDGITQGFAWSPDSRRVCTWTRQGVTGGTLRAYDIDTAGATNLLADLVPADARLADAFGCAWSRDGRLAAGFTDHYPNAEGQIAVLNEEFKVTETSAPIDYLDAVVGWLGNGSVVFTRAARPEPTPVAPGLFQPGVGVSDLLAPGDTILDVIP